MKSTLIKAYIFFVPFHSLINLPVVGTKIQFTELLFIPIFFYAIREFPSILNKKLWPSVDYCILLWPIVNLIPSIKYGISTQNFLELTGIIYLVLMYFSLRILLNNERPEEYLLIFVYSVLFSCVIGIIGWLFYTLFDIYNPLVLITDYYPYLGHIARVKAFTFSPSVLASMIMTAILIYYSYLFYVKKSGNKWPFVIMIILLMTMLLTFSKTAIPLTAGLIIIYLLFTEKKKSNFSIRRVATVFVLPYLFLATVYLAGTLFYIKKYNPDQNIQIPDGLFTSEKSTGSFRLLNHNYLIFSTHYLGLSKLKVDAFIQTNGLGLGSGNFNAYASEKIEKTYYPYRYKGLGRDSTYLAVLAESGVAGFTLFMVFLIFLLRMIIITVKKENSFLSLAIMGITTAVAVESIFTYTLNFRHYWIFIAVASVLNQSSMQTEE